MSSSKLRNERNTALNPNKYKKVKSKVGKNMRVSDKVEYGKYLDHYGLRPATRSQSFLDIFRSDILTKVDRKRSELSVSASNPHLMSTKNEYVRRLSPAAVSNQEHAIVSPQSSFRNMYQSN
jgi:hypothetical protein